MDFQTCSLWVCTWISSIYMQKSISSIYIQTYISSIYLHTYIHILHMHTYMWIFKCALCMQMHMYVCICVCIYICICICIYICTYIHIYICTYVHIYIHTYIYIHVYIYTYMLIVAYFESSLCSHAHTRGKYFGGFACCARASVCVMSARALTLVRRARCVQELCPHVFTCTLHAVLTCTLHASKQRWPAPRCGPRVVFGQPTVRRWEHARPFPLRLASLPFCSALVRGGRGFSIADAAEEGGGWVWGEESLFGNNVGF